MALADARTGSGEPPKVSLLYNPALRSVVYQVVTLVVIIGADLGLPKDWAVQIIKAVGNYGESFERNVGEGSPLKIARGLNGLWTKGGLQYAPPIR